MKKNSEIRYYPMIIILSFLVVTLSCEKEDENNSITDFDGNVYTSVTIGTQVWMVENLKVTHYRNGDPIPNITDQEEWNNLTTGAYSEYDNAAVNGTGYGKLYNHFAISDSRNLCPAGWHIPTEAEWNELIDHLGGEAVAGGKLKATGTIEGGDGLWHSPNTDATNETGFTALPGGLHTKAGFFDFSYGGLWWSSTVPENGYPWYCYINHNSGIIGNGITGKNSGFSVRCIKD